MANYVDESAKEAGRRAAKKQASKMMEKKKTTKTVATPGTKVSQATIDKIKAMGMTKALKGAANASPEMREGLKRLYGAKRVAAAAPTKPASTKYSPVPMGSAKGASTAYSPAPRKASTSYSPVKKAAPAKKPTFGGFSIATKALGNVGGRVERTPARQKELEALQAKLKAKRDAKKNK